MKTFVTLVLLLSGAAAFAETAPIRTCEHGGPGSLDVLILRSLNCQVLPREQALYIANHLSKFPLSDGLCAHNQVFNCPPPKPANPTNRYIAEHPSQYDLFEVIRALDEVKKGRP